MKKLKSKPKKYEDGGAVKPKYVTDPNLDLQNAVNRFREEGGFTDEAKAKTAYDKWVKNSKGTLDYPIIDPIDIVAGGITALAKNPLKFKPNPNASYRVIGGEEGLKDALESKVIRANPKGSGEGVLSRPSDVAYYEKGKIGNYPGEYMVETKKPTYYKGEKNPVLGNEIRSRHYGAAPYNEQGLKYNLPLEDVEIYKKDWLKGYKKINKYANGGKVKPKYVTDPNDPALKAYNDSLDLYKRGEDIYSHLSTAIQELNGFYDGVDGLDKIVSNSLRFPKTNNKPIKTRWLAGEGNGKDNNKGAYISYDKNNPNNLWKIDQYKKPVQPVIYQPKENDEIPDSLKHLLGSELMTLESKPKPKEVKRKDIPLMKSIPLSNEQIELQPKQYQAPETYMMPDGNKYTKDELLQQYPQMKNNKTFNKNFPKKYAKGGSILDTETQNSKRILVGPDSLGNNQFINTSIPELTPEFQHSMPDGQKYKYNDLIKAYPGMANTNVYKKTFNRLPPARPVPVFDTGGEISDNPPSMGDKYGNQQINAMKADGSIRGNGSSSFFKSKGFQQGVQGATQGLNAYNTSLNQDSVGNPYRQREEQSYQSTMGVVGQTGLVGSVIAGGAALGDAIGSPIRNRSEQTTETGQLQSRRKFINGNAAGSFFDPLRSSLSAFNDPEASTGEKIGSVLGWGAAFGKRRANRFEDRAINQRVQEENQAADTGNSDFMYGNGGEVVPTQINVEKGELLSSPEGKILKEYRNKPLHPNKGINLDGNTTEQPGHYIIPRKMAKTFAEGDKLRRNTILMNLQSQEPEGKMKKGGMVYKAEKGMRIPKMDGETDGSVIPYNQNWYPGLDMQLPVYSNERGFGQANTVGGDLPLMQSKAYTAPVYSNDLTIQPRRNSAQITPQNAPGDNPKEPWWKNQRVGNTASTIGGALVNNFGPLAYLFGEGKKYDKVNYGSVNPELLDPREELAQAQLENNSLNASIRDASGGNTGSYLTNRIVANRQNFMNKAKTLRDYTNTNAGIKNQFKRYNKTNEIRAKEAEAQNKGQAQTNYYGALSNLGRNTAGSISDAQKAKRDEQMLKLYSNIYQNYDFNPDTYEFTLKKDKTKS